MLSHKWIWLYMFPVIRPVRFMLNSYMILLLLLLIHLLENYTKNNIPIWTREKKKKKRFSYNYYFKKLNIKCRYRPGVVVIITEINIHSFIWPFIFVGMNGRTSDDFAVVNVILLLGAAGAGCSPLSKSWWLGYRWLAHWLCWRVKFPVRILFHLNCLCGLT